MADFTATGVEFKNQAAKDGVREVPHSKGQATASGSDLGRAATLGEIRMDSAVDTNSPQELSGDDGVASFQHFLGASAVWSNLVCPTEILDQQQYMDWSAVDSSTFLDVPSVLPAALTPTSGQQPSLSSLGLLPLITSTTTSNLSWQDQLASQSCHCRAGLAQLIPNAKAALRERQLDGVLRVTSDVIRGCEAILGCGACSVNCTDLICIMAVFQEADACFEHVAKGEIVSSINVSMGSYEVEIGAADKDAPQWRRMLVAQLVRRAHRLLDSISVRGQDMLKALDPACQLGRVNIDYLEAVIKNSRDNLERVMDGLDKTVTA